MSAHTASKEAITVQVAYALPDRQMILTVSAHGNATVMDAIRHSGILQQFPELSQTPWKTGIFGHIVAPETLLEAGMRIEIYRPLQIDPKASRRQRAQVARKHLNRKK
jgi:putative ubiquitin-RnfH superfamily antitoxin RatB of RatAB toxin-antitoxin module